MRAQAVELTTAANYSVAVMGAILSTSHTWVDLGASISTRETGVVFDGSRSLISSATAQVEENLWTNILQ